MDCQVDEYIHRFMKHRQIDRHIDLRFICKLMNLWMNGETDTHVDKQMLDAQQMDDINNGY